MIVRQQVVQLGQGDQAPLERGPFIGERGCALQRLRGDRLHGRERVLDAVVQLVDEQLLFLVRDSPLGDVA